MQKEGFIVRLLIGLLFVVAGFGKLMNFDGTVGYVASLGVPLASIATIIVIIIELPVATAFILGLKNKYINVEKSAIAMIVFTALATLLAHNNIGEQMQMIMALKNIAIIGALMMFVPKLANK